MAALAPPTDGRVRLATRYAWIGAVLGVGAPLGFAALRRLLSRGPRTVPHPLDDRRLPYLYMGAATPIVFGLFGHLLGRHADQAQAAHEDVERLREEFAAVVAHDLRNPIQAILLQLQLLLRKAPEGPVMVTAPALQRLQRSGQRLARMVDDLLDATRIEASRLSLRRETVSLPDAVTALVERIRPTLGAHPIEITVDGEPPPVTADPTRLDQILTNLVENAAKYSPDTAKISIHVRAAAGGAEVSVQDLGPGIGPEELDRLFDRFYQSKRAREKKTGLGLGLYITKGLVEGHGGRLDVRSELGKGSTFAVWLPRATAP